MEALLVLILSLRSLKKISDVKDIKKQMLDYLAGARMLLPGEETPRYGVVDRLLVYKMINNSFGERMVLYSRYIPKLINRLCLYNLLEDDGTNYECAKIGREYIGDMERIVEFFCAPYYDGFPDFCAGDFNKKMLFLLYKYKDFAAPYTKFNKVSGICLEGGTPSVTLDVDLSRSGFITKSSVADELSTSCRQECLDSIMWRIKDVLNVCCLSYLVESGHEEREKMERMFEDVNSGFKRQMKIVNSFGEFFHNFIKAIEFFDIFINSGPKR